MNGKGNGIDWRGSARTGIAVAVALQVVRIGIEVIVSD